MPQFSFEINHQKRDKWISRYSLDTKGTNGEATGRITHSKSNIDDIKFMNIHQ